MAHNLQILHHIRNIKTKRILERPWAQCHTTEKVAKCIAYVEFSIIITFVILASISNSIAMLSTINIWPLSLPIAICAILLFVMQSIQLLPYTAAGNKDALIHIAYKMILGTLLGLACVLNSCFNMQIIALKIISCGTNILALVVIFGCILVKLLNLGMALNQIGNIKTEQILKKPWNQCHTTEKVAKCIAYVEFSIIITFVILASISNSIAMLSTINIWPLSLPIAICAILLFVMQSIQLLPYTAAGNKDALIHIAYKMILGTLLGLACVLNSCFNMQSIIFQAISWGTNMFILIIIIVYILVKLLWPIYQTHVRPPS